MSSVRCVSILLLVVLFIGAVPVHAALDSTLFTTYNLNAAHTRIDWTVCGSLPLTSGCYGGGSIGPFGKVGAMLEGNPATNVARGTVTRSIYVLDIGYGNSGNEVALYVYKKVDTIAGSGDTITVTLFKTVILPLAGGSSASASMAANNMFLYIGTDQTQLAVQLKKSNFAITQFGAISAPINVSSITADKYGFVTVTWGDSKSGGGFLVLSPTGVGQVDGGGVPFMLNTVQATLPASLP